MADDARIDAERQTERRARLVGLSYVDSSQIVNKQIFKDILDNDELIRLRVVPMQVDASHIFFGVTTNTSHATMQSLKQRFSDQIISYAMISDAGFAEYMSLYNPPKKVVYQDIEISNTGTDQLVGEVSRTLESVRADDMLAYLVSQAHNLNASDIHCENQRDEVRIRLRVDGVLHPIARLSKDKYRILMSAVASAGDISTASDEAQQGHISQRVKMADGKLVDVNIRLETVPTINGMDIVMRLFNMDASTYNLDRLGLSPGERQVIDNIISKPSGLVMVVGPTGSGKTTTLYSILNSLLSDERKIITVEDPVEYQFEGITQISLRSSEKGDDGTFASKLRAILRLDPDIVMVGEIRDLDTARTALQAALTGHLVLATFHASSAAAALTRLADIIGQNPLFVSAIRLVMAQRLVRRLDDNLKMPRKPSMSEMTILSEVINTLPAGAERPDLSRLELFSPGSSAENPYGYTGQIAIREQFQMTGKIRQILENQDHVLSAQEIEQAAVESGMLTMAQDGVLKVCAGQTTLDELYRVVG